MKAIFNGSVIAESDETVVVENNHYFPEESVVDTYISQSDTTTKCPWKGTANYINLDVDGEHLEDAGWVYHDPKPEAENIRDRYAFWKSVDVVDD